MGILIFLAILFFIGAFWKDIIWVLLFIGLMFLVLMVGGIINVWGGVSIDSIMPLMMKILIGFIILSSVLSVAFEGFRNFICSILSSVFK
ncbi:hypothetical protein FG877_02165 [Enterococcus casseliflavus]|nr:hypothetical protein [Enterococcus casseliflavus]